MQAVCERPQEIDVGPPEGAFPAVQDNVSVREQDDPAHKHSVHEDVQVAVPVHEPVPTAPKYCPQVPEVASSLAPCATTTTHARSRGKKAPKKGMLVQQQLVEESLQRRRKEAKKRASPHSKPLR